MKNNPGGRHSSFFNQRSNPQAINQLNPALEESKANNQTYNNESLVILLKEDNKLLTNNIINTLSLTNDALPLVKNNRANSLDKEKKKIASIGSIDIGKRRQSVIEFQKYPHSALGAGSGRFSFISASKEKEEQRTLKIIEKICDSSAEEESDLENNNNDHHIIPHDNKLKVIWDHFIIVYVIIIAIFLPFIVAFTADTTYIVVFEVFNTIFMSIEIGIRFKSSYIDADDNLIEKQKIITANYLRGWFIVDIITWFPYSLCALDPSPYPNKETYSRFDRDISLPQKILLLIPLIQIVKILLKGQLLYILKKFFDLFNLNDQIERLIYFLFSFVLLNHVVACLWFFTANLQYFHPNCWVVRLGFLDRTIGELYLACYSWSLATITTIGYGNVNAGTSLERVYNLIVMSFGVVMFSFAIGSLSSIVNISDSKTEEMNQKLQMLTTLKKEYKIDKEIYERIRASIKYNHHHNDIGTNHTFLKDLPPRLAIELSQIMHDSKIKKMNFFIQHPDDNLFAFAAPLFKPVQFIQRDLLYKCNDKIEEMYFISIGTVSFSFGPEYNEKEIKMLKKHTNFGEMEMCIGELLSYNIKVKSRTCNLFVLKKADFLKLSIRFPEIIEEFMQKSLMIYLRFKNTMKTMINKQNHTDDKINDSNTPKHFSIEGNDEEDEEDKQVYLDEDELELECIDEDAEEEVMDNDGESSSHEIHQETIIESQSSCNDTGSSLISEHHDERIIRLQSESEFTPIKSRINHNTMEDFQSEAKKLNYQFNCKINTLIDFISDNKIQFGDTQHKSILNILKEIRSNQTQLKLRNAHLLQVEKMLSEAIPNI